MRYPVEVPFFTNKIPYSMLKSSIPHIVYGGGGEGGIPVTVDLEKSREKTNLGPFIELFMPFPHACLPLFSRISPVSTVI